MVWMFLTFYDYVVLWDEKERRGHNNLSIKHIGLRRPLSRELMKNSETLPVVEGVTFVS